MPDAGIQIFRRRIGVIDDMGKQPLLNTYVNNVDMDEAIAAIEQMITSGRRCYTVAVNVDVVVKMEKDKYLKEITDKADLTFVDGKPLVWISHWHKHPVKARVSGSDLVPILCGRAEEMGYSLFIIGGADGIAEKAKANLETMHPDIKIVGTYAPPFGFEKDETELGKINSMISAAHPDILIVCFGCPKQEKWIYENYQKYDARVSVCAGATVDFLAGNVKRAPKWMADHGWEWLWRCTQEPERLFKRYFVEDMAILGLARKYKK